MSTFSGALPISPRYIDHGSDEGDDSAAQELLVKNIRELIKVRGLNASRFALEVGVSRSLVSRWLSRDQVIGLEYLDSIARVLGVAVGQLFEGGEPPEVDLETALRIVAKHARAGKDVPK